MTDEVVGQDEVTTGPERGGNLTVCTPDEEKWIEEDDLDVDYILQCGREIADTLSGGQVADVAYQPGDGTFYGLVFTPLWGSWTAPARVVGGRVWDRYAVRGVLKEDGTGYRHGAVLVSYVENSAYPIMLVRDQYLDASYVREHWFGSRKTGSAISVTLLLRAISERMS